MDNSPQVPSTLERRLAAEWDLLKRLAAVNPERLSDLSAADLTFQVRLRRTPGILLPSSGAKFGNEISNHHALTLTFPRYFPAAPIELYLNKPVQHPNVHPETGFVCLWDKHRVSHTVEHALHKLVAILGWRLYNSEETHVMQPEALDRMRRSGAAIAARLNAAPLQGVVPEEARLTPIDSALATAKRRRRLS